MLLRGPTTFPITHYAAYRTNKGRAHVYTAAEVMAVASSDVARSLQHTHTPDTHTPGD